jgi:hypothetical protein
MKLIYCLSVLLYSFLMIGCSHELPSLETGNDSGSSSSTNAYFISPTGSDDNTGRAEAFPFKSFDKVLTVVKPGDVVNVMPGTFYANGKPIIDLLSKHSGESDKYITFKAHDPHNKPILSAAGNNVWNAVNINASYIIIDGLELAGGNASIDKTEAYNNAYAHKYNPGSVNWSRSAYFNTNGITVGGSGQSSERPDHVIVRNCIIHDFPGGGISAIQADYITFENNQVYNNSWYTMYACSGISILTPVNSDRSTGYKNIIRNNICYNNRTEIPWIDTSNFSFSDGNGIIVDINITPQSSGVAVGEGEYTGRTLVENNVSFNNGGSGIHSFKAKHVDIVNNTAYHNTCKYETGYAEIWTNNCEDVNIVNNIMYARSNGNCNLPTQNATEKYSHNLYFNGKINMKTGTGDKEADPLFVNLSTDGEKADFHLRTGSPAIGHGIHSDYMSGVDIEGNPRPASRVDAGAYQYASK